METDLRFGVYPRKLKSGKITYYYWAYRENGRRIYRSTGVDTFEKAILHCRNLLKIGKLVAEKSFLLEKFTENFFVFEACLFVLIELRAVSKRVSVFSNFVCAIFWRSWERSFITVWVTSLSVRDNGMKRR